MAKAETLEAVVKAVAEAVAKAVPDAVEKAVPKAVEEALAPLDAKLGSMHDSIDALHDQLARLTSRTAAVEGRAAVLEERADRADAERKDDREGLLDELEKLDRKVADNEDRDRRSNIVLSGLAATRDNVEAVILGHLEKLGVKLGERDIIRAHHLGKDIGTLICKFQHFKDTERVLAAAYERGDVDGVHVKADFSVLTRKARGQLFGTLLRLKREAAGTGRVPRLKVNRIVDGSASYYWHDRRGRVECRRRGKPVEFLPLEPTGPGLQLPPASGANAFSLQNDADRDGQHSGTPKRRQPSLSPFAPGAGKGVKQPPPAAKRNKAGSR